MEGCVLSDLCNVLKKKKFEDHERSSKRGNPRNSASFFTFHEIRHFSSYVLECTNKKAIATKKVTIIKSR